ncbi:type VI secretion system secreted protein VgrG [Pseudomonas laurylsulfativorans]|uniref:type VI secretion system Vgr family protein n=1 Tax=Pseudomonas laurylsulfativorans TaxID=1943631 RepID=UPI0020A138B9|nr:type VI secretion system Vgr family protein [Pseudomonas laurylsulfativorans]MCP1418001.1 type VI secretion system secreted protein VgrG [Pseudomonas laurylsulfativorans]
MSNTLRTFFDHSCHKLQVDGLDTALDVLAFEGHEYLSQPYLYRIEFTANNLDIGAEKLIGQYAEFSLYAPPSNVPVFDWEVPKPRTPLRTLYGRITASQRLSASVDEARYEVTLQPRLALLDRGQQTRIYQHQSVPDIVKSILRDRHGLLTGHFRFNLKRDYPQREQVMQYQESDLAFISRILAEVGIWYRCFQHEELAFDVVEFCDDQRCYQFDVELPLRSPSGFSNSEQDSVWALRTRHRVVEQHVSVRAYHPDDSRAWLDGEVDQTLGEPTTHGVATTRGVADNTYGDAYHYAEPYRVLGKSHLRDEDLQSESGFFYARLRHERYLNNQTHLSGTSSSATLAPGQVLTISGDAPKAFTPRVVITKITTRAARDRSLTCDFEAMPYALRLCFRPEILPKPQIAGTLPARITHPQSNPLYTEIDMQGRYRVKFLFDRDTWPAGRESKWLRQARAYAGDTYGLHLPLIAGTEVAIAFEQGDPDKPYIAHALHDDQHPDLVTQRNDHRNVLRTPANNKLRMDDTRGQEHVKLSTEYGGKSQLNLGHLVDVERKKRGEGFELRTDDWGAIRGGKGLFISADKQEKAKGAQLDMDAAVAQLESALSLARSLADAARAAETTPGDTASQERLRQVLDGLKQPGLLLHAPAGIGMVSPEAVSLSSGSESVGIVAAHNVDLSAGQNITATAEDGISLLAHSADMQLKAAKGNIDLHALEGLLHALAKGDIKIESVDGRVHIRAEKELILECGGVFVRLKDGDLDQGAPGNIYQRAKHVQKFGSARLDTPTTPLPGGYSAKYVLKDEAQAPLAFTRYRITTEQGEVFNGVTDKEGRTMSAHTLLPGGLKIEFPNTTSYDEQLRLLGPNGELASNIKYSATLADGRILDGVTDEQGYTQRLVTEKPTQITQLLLFPPEDAQPFCCAAQNAQAPMQIDLTSSDVSTNDTDVGRSTKDVPLPKGKKRSLTSGEIAMAQTVFKDAVNYSKVKVHHGGWWLFAGFQNTAVTPNGEMYFPESTELYKDDFYNSDDHRDKALFMHEMTHVWQYQLGYPVKKAGLTVSSRGAEAYRYSLKKNGKLSDYNMEQQGEIISDYYMISIEGKPGSVWNRSNTGMSRELLTTTLEKFLANPFDKSNLPG